MARAAEMGHLLNEYLASRCALRTNRLHFIMSSSNVILQYRNIEYRNRNSKWFKFSMLCHVLVLHVLQTRDVTPAYIL
jgi:hypothetical protein